MSTHESGRFSARRIAVGLGAAALLAGAINVPAAFAATVNNAIKSINVDETSAAAGDSVKVSVVWAVPDGSKKDDTFTLTLPTMLVTNALDGVTRELKDSNGEVVATYVVHGQVVTFTLTEYAEGHTGISGTAYFGVELARDLATDPRTPVQFRVNGAVWPQVDYIDVTGPRPDHDYSTSATKWQNWTRIGTDPRGGILWSIVGPSVPESLTHGDTYVIEDTPAAGQSILCDQVTVWQGDKNVNGVLENRQFVGSDRYTKTCSASTATVTIKPAARDIGKVFMMLGTSEVTDKNLTEYKNSGTVTMWGTANYPVSSTLRVSAGGDGQGVTPAPTPTGSASPTPTDTGTPPAPTVTVTVPGPTVTAPGSTVTAPGSTTTVIVNPAPPVIVQPGTPAPTSTVTTTATVTANPTPIASGTPISSGTPVASGTPTVTVTATTTPVSSGTPVSGGAPASSGTTTTVTRTVSAAPVAGGTRVSSGSPTRIDTGQPADEVNSALLAAGGLLTAGSVGALGLAARDTLRRRRR
ncbi:MAG: Ig-like domain-containing protein [Dermatophilus congolensis]|nr:Ig-like domain-containing protein [Dermatophilus congolensis]